MRSFSPALPRPIWAASCCNSWPTKEANFCQKIDEQLCEQMHYIGRFANLTSSLERIWSWRPFCYPMRPVAAVYPWILGLRGLRSHLPCHYSLQSRQKIWTTWGREESGVSENTQTEN